MNKTVLPQKKMIDLGTQTNGHSYVDTCTYKFQKGTQTIETQLNDGITQTYEEDLIVNIPNAPQNSQTRGDIDSHEKHTNQLYDEYSRNPKTLPNLQFNPEDMEENVTNNGGPTTNDSLERTLYEEVIEILDEVDNTSNKEKSRILVVGDETGKYIPTYLHKHVDHGTWEIYGNIKPGIEFLDLTRSLFDLSLQYGNNDVIFVIFNTYNISNWHNLKKALKLLLKLSKVTNLVILSKRGQADDINIEKFIRNKIYNFSRINKNCSLYFELNVDNIHSKTMWLVKNYFPKCVNNNVNIVLKTIQVHNNIDMTDKLQKFFRGSGTIEIN